MARMAILRRWLWDLLYLLGKTPWDTGITPPELVRVVESGQVPPGRALDLGCGTGTNVIYLAQHGFEVVGVDISSRAIVVAHRKIEQARLNRRARVYAGDVTRLDGLPVTGPFDLALDMGCFHSLDLPGRRRYIAGLTRRMKPGGLYLLYAFGPRVQLGRGIGLAPEDARRLYSPTFELLQVEHGQDRGGIGSAWYTFQMSNLKFQTLNGDVEI
jgi:cyclopropane fatty-acyl-phospholipid synthase-like methyltransferase